MAEGVGCGGSGGEVFRGGGGGGQLSDICSAETRGQAGSWHWRPRCWRRWREAGSRRGGGTGSRRWMALTENRLLKQHDISWNGGSHTHTNMHSWQTHTPIHAFRAQTATPPSFSCSVTSLYLTAPQPHTSSFLKAAMSSTESPLKGVFHLQSTNARPGFIHGTNYFPVVTAAAASLPSPPVLYRLSSSFLFLLEVFLENQTPLMNHEADICGKAATTLT